MKIYIEKDTDIYGTSRFYVIAGMKVLESFGTEASARYLYDEVVAKAKAGTYPNKEIIASEEVADVNPK
jgi:hypothetical protein